MGQRDQEEEQNCRYSSSRNIENVMLISDSECLQLVETVLNRVSTYFVDRNY